MPGKLDGIAAVEAFKEMGERVGTMGPKDENFIKKTQPEAGFLVSGVKEILFKETHEQVGIGRGHKGAHGSSLNLLYEESHVIYLSIYLIGSLSL